MLRTLSAQWIRLFILPFLFWNGGVSSAQELSFSGVGPINHSLAGTAIALPRDSAGAIYWNPATISFLEHSEFQLGLGRHNAPWYGDESVVIVAAIPVAVVLFGLWITSDDPFDSNRNRSNTRRPSWMDYYETDTSPDPTPPPDPTPSSTTPPKSPVIRVPTLSYVYPHWVVAGRTAWAFRNTVQ